MPEATYSSDKSRGGPSSYWVRGPQKPKDQPSRGRFTARDIEPEELVSPEVGHELEQSVTIPERGMSHAVKLIRTVVKE
jgi:hypothetical protein